MARRQARDLHPDQGPTRPAPSCTSPTRSTLRRPPAGDLRDGDHGPEPEVRSWSTQGPVWGAPDGCRYNFVFNNVKAPWNDVNVRLAINYAIDRQQITDLGYEGAMRRRSCPSRATSPPSGSPGRIQAVLDKYDRGTPSQAKVDEFMGKAGFAKNAAGFWAKDGKTLDIYFSYLDFMLPIGPVLQQQSDRGGLQDHIQGRSQVGRVGLPGRPAQLGPRPLQQLR